ncbi:ubiquitin thioesterase otulin isoform X2 [Rana temporaria]|uniref:ubiquitin thioesterase otulin isoform X2 n=1 Tax=Rana temporaria TaxID=8407 RepID=UPI001AAD2051|nr:ubiquitin thioesterase otulin isoform X2 [Rana temporaria]
MDLGSVPESCRTSGTEIRASSEGLPVSSKQDADVTPKEEVECTPESTQQLEPEFLNCAVDVSLFKETNPIVSANNRGPDLENGGKSHNLDSGEACTYQHPQMMACDPKNTAVVEVTEKRLSSITSPLVDENADMMIIPDCCKRSRRLPEPQPLRVDGDGAVRNAGSVCEPQPVTDVSPLSNKCEDCKVDSGEENEDVQASSHLLSNKPENDLPELLGQDGASTFQTTETTLESKDGPVQPCTLGKNVMSPEMDEDIYRDEEEIEKEKTKKGAPVCEKGFKDDPKLGVGPEFDIIEYCRREWRGNTPVAKQMREGYKEVSHAFGAIRQVRGDNYCALRATLFQCLSQTAKLPQWLNNADLIQLPEKLNQTYDWINLWRFWSPGSKTPGLRIKEYLELLKKKWAEMSKMKISDKKQVACDEIFQTEEEYCLYEAVKFLMLRTAVDLYNANENGVEVPVFSWLLFARNTSNNPCEFMKNHLNQVGHSGGLEQVEMFLLGYALQHTIKVYRLYKYGTDEFITQYPDDQADWPVVTLITEDDRHYNVPVRVCEETSL